MLHYVEDLPVVLVDKFDDMRKVAPVSFTTSGRSINAKEPYADTDVLLGTHPEEILLLVALVQSFHDNPCRF